MRGTAQVELLFPATAAAGRPTVGGALSTTAVVIGIVVGSTFVLLSVNSVLSALSQKLFG